MNTISKINIEKNIVLIIIQLLLFLFLIIPMSFGLGNFIFVLIFIILEAGSILNILLKKEFKYSLLIWIFQFYLIFILEIIIQPAIFFSVQDITSTPILVLGVLATLIQLTISLLIFFGERMVKPVLIGLSSSTTFIVFLMVFFIAQQGLLTFEETNPIDFITGTEWTAYYQHPHMGEINLTISPIKYNYSVKFENPLIYVSPNHTFSIQAMITNTGGLKDTYSLSFSSSNDITFNVSNKEVTVMPNSKKSITINFYTPDNNEFFINMGCISKNSNIEKNASLKIISQNNAFIIKPKSILLNPDRHELQTISGRFHLLNSGNSKETYNISINCTSIFRPNIRELDNWNYSTKSGTISLDPYQSINLTIIPRMVYERDGNYNLTINIKSLETNIEASTNLIFRYFRKDIFSVDSYEKTIPLNGSGIFNFSTESNIIYDLIIGDIPIGMELSVLQNETEIFSGSGITNISVIDNQNAFQIKIYNYDYNNKPIDINVKLGFRGTSPSYGILMFIAASAVTTLIAVAIAGPLGLAIAIFLSEYLPKKWRHVLRSLFDLLAGIPSVIYGFWGFITLGPIFGQYVFPYLFGIDISNGRTLLTASFVLIFMILPIVIALSNDAIQSVEQKLKNGSLALGATRWQTMRYVIVPNAKSGIIASIILATGRAIGETMAVLMITAGLGAKSLQLPDFLFSQSNTLTTVIAQIFPWGIELERTRYALFAIGFFLFIIIFILNIIIYNLQRNKKKSKLSKFFRKNINKIITIKNHTKINNSKNKQDNNINDKKFIIIDEKQNKTLDLKKFRIIGERNIKAKHSRKSLVDKNVILNSTKKAINREKVVITTLYFLSFIVTGFLFFIIGDIIIKGSVNLKIDYFLKTEQFIGGGYEGGFANALVGSLQLVAFALAVAIPLSLGAAIYINEYAKKENIFTKIILFTSDTLASTPSIVFGAFGFMFLVGYLDFKKSLFAGGVTLGLMVIPLILRSSIEAIKSVPDSFREGSYALGISKWKTIRNVVIPPATPSISSGLIIGIGRAIGETAAILFTAGYTSHIATSIFHPVASMPNMIYSYFKFSATFPALEEKLFSVAFLLITIVLILNLSAKIIAYQSSKMMRN